MNVCKVMLSMLFLFCMATTAMACNCGKKNAAGAQASSCQCGSSCTENACSDSPAKSTGQEKAETETEVLDVGNIVCPVSGKPIGSMGEGVIYTHNGKAYHLCCPGCIDEFKAQPDYYIKKLETMEIKTNNKGE